MVRHDAFRYLVDQEDPAYSPLPGGGTSQEGPNRPARAKVVAAALSGLLVLGILVGSLTEKMTRVENRDARGGALSSVHGGSAEKGVPAAATVTTISRGVSAGVSEKSNRAFLGANVESFPWNNSMLSWQRTAYHFQPEKNWMNDPNGPMYYKGWYHIFYQYNPDAAIWGNIVWGHAISKDLIHWLHLPLAMVADQWYDLNGVWSGSATILPDGRVIMLYTGSTNESVQVQNLAYPADLSDPLLIDWVKFPGNPILFPPHGIDKEDFRDPTTAWITSEGKWRITVGSKVNKTGLSFVYETEDFESYKLLPGIFHAVPGTGMWECVDFYPVSVDSENGLDTSANGLGIKHVMKASLDDDRHDYYAIGVYDEKANTWVPDNSEIDVGIGIRYDYGIFYASKTFYDKYKQRRILWGWIGESDSEFADVQKGWASLQGVPRTVVLDRKTGTNLVQWPIEEVDDLRLSRSQFESITVKPGSVTQLNVGTATQVDVVAEFELDKAALDAVNGTDSDYQCTSSGGASQRGALGPFGLLVLAEDSLSEQTPVYFYIVKGQDSTLKTHVCNDQLRSSEAYDVVKSVNGSFVPVLEGEKLSLRILVDHSIVETFAQGGRACITSRVYPTKAIYGDARIFLFNNATSTPVTASIEVWQMNSAFIRPYNPTR